MSPSIIATTLLKISCSALCTCAKNENWLSVDDVIAIIKRQ